MAGGGRGPRRAAADSHGAWVSLIWSTQESFMSKATLSANRIYAGIPVTNTKIEHSSLEVADEAKSAVKGGFHYGVCRRPGVYLPPRPLMNHGPHRCKSSTRMDASIGETLILRMGRLLPGRGVERGPAQGAAAEQADEGESRRGGPGQGARLGPLGRRLRAEMAVEVAFFDAARGLECSGYTPVAHSMSSVLSFLCLGLNARE